MIIEKKKIQDLIPAPYNPRQSTKKQEEKLKESLVKFGVVEPIVFNKRTGFIVGGHFRVRELQKLGYKEIECVIVDLSEDDEKELNIRLNANTGAWDWDALANDFDLDQLSEWGLDALGIEQEKPEAKEDDFTVDPDGEKNIFIKLGDLIELGRHRVLCGDSTIAEDAEILMGDDIAEMLFTSPPYSDMREYSGNDLSLETITNFIPTFAKHCKYLVFNLGIQRKEHNITEYWNVFLDKAKQCKEKFLAWNVWYKNTVGVGQQSSFIPIYHEWIFVFGDNFKDINRTVERKIDISKVGKTATLRQVDGSMKRGSTGKLEALSEMKSVFNSNSELGKIRKEHPATFPIELPAEYIKAMTDTYDLILDPFLGSGTTLIAADQLKRTCYGMEISPKYCQVIIKRYKKYCEDNNQEFVCKINGELIPEQYL